MTAILGSDPHPRKTVAVLDSEMSYVETGVAGPTVVFLHGNPTSSFLWRNVIEGVRHQAHCIAPDLVGMGRSGSNPAGSYAFTDHVRYLDAWFDAIVPSEPIFLVVHDWGSALGFHWARRHPERVSGIVYMEAIVSPMSWDDWPEGARGIFQAMRSEAGEEMVLQKNVFVERILPASVLRDLTESEMEIYRAPYLQPGESRRPTLTWPRQIPVDGEPAEVVAVVEDYGQWLATDGSPRKLFVNAEPGSILTGAQRELCRSWPNQREITVPGLHFIQEDSPTEIGAAIVEFIAKGDDIDA